MSNQPYGFNKDDLQGAVPIGYAVSAVIIGAVSNRLGPIGHGSLPGESLSGCSHHRPTANQLQTHIIVF